MTDLISKVLAEKPAKTITTLSLRVDSEYTNRIDAVANKVGKTRSDILREFIDAGLQQLEEHFNEKE